MNGLGKGDLNGTLHAHNHGLLRGAFTGLKGSDDAASSYCLEAKTLFLAMNVQPDPIRKKLIDYTIKQLKLSGAWDNIAIIYFLAAHDSQAAKLNWKNPGSLTLTEVSSPTFTIDRGYAGNGSSSYLNSGFIESSSPLISALSVFAGVYSRTNSDGAITDYGANETGRGISLQSRSSNIFNGRVHNASGVTIANIDSSGFLWARLTGTSTAEKGRNKTSLGTAATTNVGINTTREMYIGALNNAGTANGFSSRQYSLVIHGSGLIDVNTTYDIIQNYMTQIGANV